MLARRGIALQAIDADENDETRALDWNDADEARIDVERERLTAKRIEHPRYPHVGGDGEELAEADQAMFARVVLRRPDGRAYQVLNF